MKVASRIAAVALLAASACGDSGAGSPRGQLAHDAAATEGGTVDSGALEAGADGDSADAGLDSGRPDAGGPGHDGFHGGGLLSDAGALGSGSSCEEKRQLLQAALYQGPHTFTLVIRLDYTTRRLLAYQIFVGRYAHVGEAEARSRAELDLPFLRERPDAEPIGPEAAEDAHVFFAVPVDSGGVAAVSARLGVTVFGGSVVHDGRGDIVYPRRWRDVSELGHGCAASAELTPNRGVDLRFGNGGELAQEDVDRALDVVQETVLPDAIAAGGYVFDSLVIAYPRRVGEFDETAAEWIVLVNGGWLE